MLHRHHPHSSVLYLYYTRPLPFMKPTANLNEFNAVRNIYSGAHYPTPDLYHHAAVSVGDSQITAAVAQSPLFGSSELGQPFDDAAPQQSRHLLTLDSRGIRRVYGPFGDVPQSNITTVHGTVYGFYGRVGMDHSITALTGLGFYT